MQRVPYEGVSRMQTSLRRKHRDRVVRRGLALIIESDFYATDAGRQHFADQLTSIRYCVQETCNFDTLYAYLTCGNYDFNYDRSKNLRPKRNIRTAMNNEIMLYGIAQKEQLGFDKAVEECKHRMSRYGVSPNMLILPPQMLLYMALAPEQKLTYKEGGPAADARFEAGVAGYEARAFRGCGIFTSEPFEVSDDADSVQMLTRSSQIGEFYVMSPPQVKPENAQHTCDVLLYDEESDRHVRITWEDALQACCIAGATDGLPADAAPDEKSSDLVDSSVKMSNPTEEMMKANEDSLKDWYARAAAWSKHNTKSAKFEDAEYDALDKDVRIVIARPFIEHLMHNAIMTVSGRDTGATLFGPADMQLSANTQVKTIEGHYTGHFKAVVTKPQNVMIMRDVACAGYVAGCNTQFFAVSRELGKKSYSIETARTNMQDRLSFADDVGSKYGSMLAFPCTEQQLESNQGLDTVMSVTSRLLPWEVTGSGARDHSSFPGGQGVYTTYNEKLGLGGVHYGEDMKAAENQDFISQGSTNNATCFIGPHRKYDPFTKSFMSLIPGQGHFGPDAIPGDARWRRGESVSLKTARDSMVGLELAQHAQMAYSKA